jgi:hypothetical protein
MTYAFGKRTQLDSLTGSNGSNSPIPGKRTLTEQIAPQPNSAVIQTDPNPKTTCEPGDDTAPQQPAPKPERVPENACAPDGPPAPDAVVGIQSYLAYPSNFFRDLEGWGPGHYYENVRDYRTLGPGDVGLYTLKPELKDGQIYCYVAMNNKTYQNEWVIGPDSVDAFVSAMPMYMKIATKVMPLSDHLGERTGEAPGDPHIPDVLELDAFHEAPWPEPGADHEPHEGGLVSSAGSAANAARNARIRLNEYVKPAKEMANDLLAQVETGDMDHMAARDQAVNGRNALMENARARMSPGARAGSKAMKETGRTVGQMTSKKVTQLINQARGIDVTADKAAAIQAKLADDSPLWAEYAAELNGGAVPDVTMASALEKLGDSPLVSREIIASAGRSNRIVTGFAKVSSVVGVAGAAIGAGEMAYDIVTAADGQRLHAAAQDMAGFAGGLVGSEVGATAGAWFASLLPLSAEAAGPVGLVVTVIGGLAGAAVGSAAGHEALDAANEIIVGGVAHMMPNMMAAEGGGYAGMMEREARLDDPNFQTQLENAIWTLSDAMKTLEKRIAEAKDDHELETLQRARFEILQRRTVLETALTGVHLGWFDTSGGACSDDVQDQ